MSNCACRRWGPGTTCEKLIDSSGARELEIKMKAIMEEREREANFWGGTTAPLEPPILKPFCEFNMDKNAIECAQKVRQCNLDNCKNNISNTKIVNNASTSNASSQIMRFWN
jgi:hypothetical protein